jgi:pilus assembly protein CpaC
MHHFKSLSLPALLLGLGTWIALAVPGRAQEANPRIEVPVGSTVTLQMSGKQIIKAAQSENKDVAIVNIKVDDPRTVLVKGEKAGFTKVILTDKDNRTEAFEVVVGVTDVQLRSLFIGLVRKAVPTANVDIIILPGTAVITGTISNTESVPVILEIAKGLFPAVTNGNRSGGPAVINAMTIAGVQQVQLDVVVAAVNRTLVRQVGFNFAEMGANHFLASLIGNTGGGGGAGATATNNFLSTSMAAAAAGASASMSGAPNAIFGIVNDKQGFLGFINALRAESLVKILAEPRVVTLSGRPAYIIDGGTVPSVTTSSGGTNVNYIPFGTTLNFLPLVLGNGKIHLEVWPQFSTPNQQLALTVGGINPVSAPAFNTRSARVAVQMEDGQTLAIGGLIQNKINGSTNKVPLLGDLPIVGAAFRTVNYTEDEEELLILVTPRLVDPMACNQLPKYLPSQETRSPDDFELFLEGILEAPRGPRTVSLRGYTPAWRNAANASTVPCANCGMPATAAQPPAAIPSMGTMPTTTPPSNAPGALPGVLPAPQLPAPASAQQTGLENSVAPRSVQDPLLDLPPR